MNIPHDLADLYLAPVALGIEARIEELGKLSIDELALEVALASDTPDWSRRWREEALVATIEHLLDLHGWSLVIEDHALRLFHRGRKVLIAMPTRFEEYLADAAQRGHAVA
jgi:hypothetical protein